ncbi:Planctomycete cytochrome C [Rubripirellula lacrimiformis]|uniref:Planctomycete cytochrome C n=1 Tax=Rubripirellula lacrimiformis TaxID=1930273 RepID=A0A517NEC5_9BACT|nr:DUF1553 domain-containing protein [Rubripirellula lacrimiformis]QDT05484.1 Planctomycete cytochrome C [Rubripirellula lacrimiformis]
MHLPLTCPKWLPFVVLWISIGIDPHGRFAQSAEPAAQPDQQATAKQIEFFESKIRPVLVDHCYECHSDDEQESGLRVDTLEGMLQGGHAGASIVPGKPQRSLFITAVGYRDNDLRMPPEGKLSDAQVADISRWIEMGAPHPDSGSVKLIRRTGDVDLDEGRQHWAFQPPVRTTPPEIDGMTTAVAASDRHSGWIDNPVDAFIIAGLQRTGLTRVPAADKLTLIRRATFDLIGLPPTVEEIDQFLADDSDQAFARVVDRLLASPHYGERWGRHWLDIARYADSNGVDENVAHGNAWRYRDYVVDAFNNDKPYDQFVVQQLAGDLLPDSDSYQQRNERLIATGFLVLGPKFLAEQDEAKMEMDIIDEQIDTIGRSMMGLTLGCARCHTHKFDPISHHDYYGLAGIFKSTQTMDSYKTVAVWHENEIASPQQLQQQECFDRKVESKQKRIDQFIADATETLEPKQQELALAEREKLFDQSTTGKLKTLRDELVELKKEAPELPKAMGVIDGEVADTSIHLRGSHLTLGDVVPRRFPQVLVPTDQSELPDDRSGRLEFARWLASPDHPLTARVMVNRIWRGHFGKGLVTTVDNFGIQGSPPSHPQLLDWLATEFVERGWSVKSMHRTIMLSQTYQMASDYDPKNIELDPENQWYWRQNLRRLEAEAIRDGLLAISGKLDLKTGGSELAYDNRAYVFNHTSDDKSSYDTVRRSIYVPVIRNHLYDMFRLFDYSDASVLTGDRNVSTVAPQALFMMNSDLMGEIADSVADRILGMSTDFDQRIQAIYRQTFGRPASEHDVAIARQFIDAFPAESADQGTNATDANRKAWQAYCQAVLSSSEFLYVR